MTTNETDLLEMPAITWRALAKFDAGDDGEPKAFKFAVVHIANFIELVFEHHIASKDPLLIYMVISGTHYVSVQETRSALKPPRPQISRAGLEPLRTGCSLQIAISAY